MTTLDIPPDLQELLKKVIDSEHAGHLDLDGLATVGDYLLDFYGTELIVNLSPYLPLHDLAHGWSDDKLRSDFEGFPGGDITDELRIAVAREEILDRCRDFADGHNVILALLCQVRDSTGRSVKIGGYCLLDYAKVSAPVWLGTFPTEAHLLAELKRRRLLVCEQVAPEEFELPVEPPTDEEILSLWRKGDGNKR